MEGAWFTIGYRGQWWTVRLTSAAGTLFTLQVRDRRTSMPASLLDFSTWDARCEQIPDLVLSQAAIEHLRPELGACGVVWRLGWKRKRGQKKGPPPPSDPRQGNLF